MTTEDKRLAGRRRGGQIAWQRRQEKAARVAAFLSAVLEQSKAAGNPVKIELANLAAQHLEAIIAGSNVGSTVGSVVGRPKRRPNLLALSAATTTLKSLLKELGTLGETVDPDAPHDKVAEVRAALAAIARGDSEQ